MQERRPVVAPLSAPPSSGAAPESGGGHRAAPGPAPGSPAGPGHDVRRARRRRLVLALVVAVIVVAVDQVTKSLAEARITHPIHLLGPLGLSLGYNSGSAFSFFTGDARILAVVAAVLVGVVALLAWRSHTFGIAAALGLVLGGAIGNLSDRLFRGHHGAVIDFITLTHWPTFNVADSCITVGVIVVALLSWRSAGRLAVPPAGPSGEEGPVGGDEDARTPEGEEGPAHEGPGHLGRGDLPGAAGAEPRP